MAKTTAKSGVVLVILAKVADHLETAPGAPIPTTRQRTASLHLACRYARHTTARLASAGLL